ncbi:hypothetical protein QJS10_CPB04g01119 [Acorus calamus]|uniref:Uncharacterized protein n=1 Tax=Acorus calamus TaxID=4465 RepID=A0AAV9F1Y4_ACOCL|nr:hypothetical protein QJS10_CPB04g01119 [Acorus calamus]
MGESNKNQKKSLFSESSESDPDIDKKAADFIARKHKECASNSEGEQVGDPDIDVKAAEFIAKKKKEWASSLAQPR